MQLQAPYKPCPDEQFKEWFKDHKAKRWVFPVHQATLEMVDWRHANGSSFYYVRYMMIQGVLHVSGDLGEAIHGWNWSPEHPWGLKDVAGCDLGYYMSKTLASSEGHKGEVWNERKAEHDIIRYFEQGIRDLTSDPITEAELREAAKGKYVEQCEKHGEPSLFNKEEFYHWAMTCGEDFLGEYWRESLGDVGMETSFRHRAQLLGLKMAMAQNPPICPTQPFVQQDVASGGKT